MLSTGLVAMSAFTGHGGSDVFGRIYPASSALDLARFTSLPHGRGSTTAAIPDFKVVVVQILVVVIYAVLWIVRIIVFRHCEGIDRCVL